MKIGDARDIMEHGFRPAGYLVSFEWVKGSVLAGDHFPDVRAGEEPIQIEAVAWDYAAQFAAKTRGKCVNIYVINAKDFTPVPGYQKRMIENR